MALVAAGLMAGSWLAAPAAHVTPAARGPALTATASVKVLTPNAKEVWSKQRTLAYWTPARMRAARPVHIADARLKPHIEPAKAHPARKPGSVAGGFAAARGPAANSTTPAGTHGSGAAAPDDGYTYPYPFDSFTVGDANSQQWPYDLNGVLFFTQDGTDLQCSATAVAAAAGTGDENEIWTAGDCLVLPLSGLALEPGPLPRRIELLGHRTEVNRRRGPASAGPVQPWVRILASRIPDWQSPCGERMRG